MEKKEKVIVEMIHEKYIEKHELKANEGIEHSLSASRADFPIYVATEILFGEFSKGFLTKNRFPNMSVMWKIVSRSVLFGLLRNNLIKK